MSHYNSLRGVSRGESSTWNLRIKQNRLLKLMEETGCPIYQINGQRIFGPNPKWTGDVPDKDCEIFVKNLPFNIFEDELVPLFQTVGIIYELRLMMTFSGENRGFCFIKYTDKASCKRAMKELHNFEIIPGKHISVLKSYNNCQLYIGNLPRDKTKEEITSSLKKEIEGIVNVIMYYHHNLDGTKENRGYAFVEFETHRLAALARRTMSSHSFKLFGVSIFADWSSPENSLDEDTMKKVKILFVRNLGASVLENDIAKAMEEVVGVACIEKVKRIKDIAFVHFTERSYAETALRCWNGQILGDTTIEVTWARPNFKHYPENLVTDNRVPMATETDLLNHTTETENIQIYQPRCERMPRPIRGNVNQHQSVVDLPVNYFTSAHFPQNSDALKILDFVCKKYNWGETFYKCDVIQENVEPLHHLYKCSLTFSNFPKNYVYFGVACDADHVKVKAAASLLKSVSSLK